MDSAFDIILVGGGLVGCTLLHELTLCGYHCLLLEKQSNLVSGASAGNSGIFHIGFDVKDGTLEETCIRNGHRKFLEYLNNFSIPHTKLGALIIARNDAEQNSLQEQYQAAYRKGFTNFKLLSSEEVMKLEPNLNGNVRGGLLVPDETSVDSCLFGVTLAHDAKRHGAQILCNQEVSKAAREMDLWRVESNEKKFYSKLVINTAGLYGDDVDRLFKGHTNIKIKPRKGQYVIFEKDASNLIKHMIYPMATKKGRGVIIFKSVYGNLVIGPTAEDCSERETPALSEDTKQNLLVYGYSILPELKQFKIIGEYAGLRPATQNHDFQIHYDSNMKYVGVCGIRSTGLTASLGIAYHVLELIGNDLKPSTFARLNNGMSSCWVTSKPSYVMDGEEYDIKHKLMNLGLAERSKL